MYTETRNSVFHSHRYTDKHSQELRYSYIPIRLKNLRSTCIGIQPIIFCIELPAFYMQIWRICLELLSIHRGLSKALLQVSVCQNGTVQ